MTGQPSPSRVHEVVERALAKQRDEATREVESILEAALRVAERAAPAAPRVADIVAEAGTSNQAFYRYFAGKDELMRAVFERGIDRVASYLGHQIAKHDEPAAQVEAWIRGVLTQVTDRRAARQSAAVNLQLAGRPASDDAGFPAALRAPLCGAVARVGSTDPDRDSSAIGELVFSVLNRHIRYATAPSAADCDHLVAFCLRALNAAEG